MKAFHLLKTLTLMAVISAIVNRPLLGQQVIISNPDFETGNLSGWTVTGADGYAWIGTGTDGDGSQNGVYNAGVWNRPIGDVEWSQSVTGLSSGYYKISCLMSVTGVISWTDGVTKRISTQRLFANAKSKLYGLESDYSATNLAVLTSLSEDYAFQGNIEASGENGPFYPVAITLEITNGNLTFGTRVNGNSTVYAFDFQGGNTDKGFYKFDHFTVTNVSSDATLDNITLNVGQLDAPFQPENFNYTATLPKGTTSVTPHYVSYVEGRNITGSDNIDVSSGSGESSIGVKSLDGTKTNIYTITYSVDGSGIIDAIKNPGFETGNLNSWSFTGTSGYAWAGVNTDGDNTKTGSYIAGTWNPTFGDVELSQTVSGLPAGNYLISADLMGSSNGTTSRLTTQRLFANNKSMLFGPIESYSAENLEILSQSETYSFGNHYETANDQGPFLPLSVFVSMDGTQDLKIGIRSNGKSSAQGYTFPNLTSGDGHGWFKVDNFDLKEVSGDVVINNISLSTGVLDDPFDPAVHTYHATLPSTATSVTPTIISMIEGMTVSGNTPVDVSSGTGVSTITVTSIDGSHSETYTIQYSKLDKSYTLEDDGVVFYFPGQTMKVRVCTDEIIQVLVSYSPEISEKSSLIVNRVWNRPSFSFSEGTDVFEISTSALKMEIDKANLNISYFDKSGALLLAENAKSINPTVVTTSSNILNTNTFSVTFGSPLDEALYGLGQHQGGIMNRKGTVQKLDQQNGEVALPFLLSTKGYGVLWDNYSESDFYGNLNGNTQYRFKSESGEAIDYYFMYGPEADDIINNYRYATGEAPMFPKWAYGFFQSKDKYTSSAELLTIANQYRNAGIGLDCIVQDWDYWTPDVWGSHVMNASNYPDPKGLIDSLHNMNIHTMISVWPLFHSSSRNYGAFEAINALYPSAGPHHFYDPHNDEAKSIFWNQLNSQLLSNYGWDALWIDNDEPQGYPDAFNRKDFITAKGSGVTYYNSYPMEHTAAVYNGWIKDRPDKRVYVLSRSALSGQQRNATTVWSGDIQSDWASYARQIPAGLNLALAGMPYWTTDIGGYFGTDFTTPSNQELMVRWYQFGAFCPIFRLHGKGDKALVSTQTFSQSTIDKMASINKLRYRLIPYVYSLAWKVTDENYTIMRHLVMDYRTDENVHSIDDQYMFGPGMLINPVTTQGATSREVYLPVGDWFDFWTGESLIGGQTLTANAPLDILPIYVKAGFILPMGQGITYANEPTDTVEVRVYPGADGKFVMYEDEGDGYDYENGAYSTIELSYNDALKSLTISNRQGSFSGMWDEKVLKLVLVTENHGVGIIDTAYNKIVTYTGSAMVVYFGEEPVETPLSAGSPIDKNLIAFVDSESQIINISYSSAQDENGVLSLIDLSGRTHFKKTYKINSGNNAWEINGAHLSPGLYIIRVQSSSGIHSRKILVNQ